MKNNCSKKLENGKKIDKEICQILKDNDIELYNRYIDSSDSFKWELMTYLAFQIGQFKTLEEAIKSYIKKHNDYGEKFVFDEIEPCCELKNSDTKGENK